jgi:hypothetical protein
MKIIICLIFAASLAPAATLSWTWAGENPRLPTETETNGKGYLTYTDGLTTIGLQDVTSFFFSYTLTYPPTNGVPMSSTVVETFTQLYSFSMVVGPNGLPTAWQMETADGMWQVVDEGHDGGIGQFFGEQIGVTGWGPITNISDPPSTAPECPTLAMLGIGLTLIGSRRFLFTKRPDA